jgi:hypothetical protein
MVAVSDIRTDGTMDPRDQYPEFSNIRSHLERIQAQHDYRWGHALADALVAAGGLLRRGLLAAAATTAWAARGSAPREAMVKRFTPHR